MNRINRIICNTLWIRIGLVSIGRSTPLLRRNVVLAVGAEKLGKKR